MTDQRRSLCYLSTAAFLLAVPAAAFAQARPVSPGVASPPAQTTAPTIASVPAGQPVDASYQLGVGDAIEINLVGRSEFNQRARISADGTILLPMIGIVHATGRTVSELADDIRQALIKGQFYSDPVIRAEVVGISSRYATVLGAVGAPGLFPLDRNYHLSEVLAKVGGRTGMGADYILVTHSEGGPSQRYYISKLAAGGPDQDPVVKTGDKIFIPNADAEVIYVSGQVNKPGTYPLTEGMTIRMALAQSGGVTENGSENKFKVTRDGKPLKSAKLDDPLKVGDIISFGERLF